MTYQMMEIDLTTGSVQKKVIDHLYREFLGGTGVATKLLQEEIDRNPDLYPSDVPVRATPDGSALPHQPLPFRTTAKDSPIFFAIGPFNGIYPLATKTVALFISPLTGNLGESHAGGNLAMVLYQAKIHVLKITGKSPFPCYIHIVNDTVEICRAHSLKGMSALATERVLRDKIKTNFKSTILRIGPAGERLSPIACVTVDTARHFGRLGLGAVFGSKNLKAIIACGNGSIELGTNKAAYLKFYKKLFDSFVHSSSMKKYHDLGTSINVIPLSQTNGLPTRNFAQGYFEGATAISGESFAEKFLSQRVACAHCPVGCIHLATLRECFDEANHMYKTNKISYDYELIYALGSNLSLRNPEEILKLLLFIEKQGWDVISMGVTLAWATEAFMNGYITTPQTSGIILQFGDFKAYESVLKKISEGETEFFRDLENGCDYCSEKYGGKDFAIRFGKNEAPGYITGLHAFLGFATGVRHSHLDSAGYAIDQKKAIQQKSLEEYTLEMYQEANWRMVLNSLVVCLFARNVFTLPVILEGLQAIGIDDWNEAKVQDIAKRIHIMKVQIKNRLGFDLSKQTLPKKLSGVYTTSGSIKEEDFAHQLRVYEKLLQQDAQSLSQNL